MIVTQESSMSRAQSPPVPARKNQLRAEGTVNYYACNLDYVFLSFFFLFFKLFMLKNGLPDVAK